jgi:hypothetical protein
MMDQEYQPTSKSSPMAIISLIAGILSVLLILTSCCILPILSSSFGLVLGILALILGLVAKKKVKEEGGLPSQVKMANAGFILGIVGIVLGLIGLVVGIIIKLTLSGPAMENLFQNIINQMQTP